MGLKIYKKLNNLNKIYRISKNKKGKIFFFLIFFFNRINGILKNKEGYIKFDSPNNNIGQSFVKAFQTVWTEIILELIDEWNKEYDYLCLTGGCALNGITNYEIVKKWGWKNVHLIPNPSDCGLAIGAALKVYWDKTDKTFNGYRGYYNPYIGEDLFDEEDFEIYLKNYPHRKIADNKVKMILAKLLHEGKIVGLIQGRCEIGPRALGNRSILCNPLIKDMREILNKKIKHREWFRPFAPVCTYEDANKFFTAEGEICYMSVICYTRKEYRKILPSVTHVDGTARLQTIIRENNPFLYDLLKEFEVFSGYPILLNTSLNPKGEPILNYLKGALEMLKTTEMDYIVYKNVLFGSPRNLDNIDKLLIKNYN